MCLRLDVAIIRLSLMMNNYEIIFSALNITHSSWNATETPSGNKWSYQLALGSGSITNVDFKMWCKGWVSAESSCWNTLLLFKSTEIKIIIKKVSLKQTHNWAEIRQNCQVFIPWFTSRCQQTQNWTREKTILMLEEFKLFVKTSVVFILWSFLKFGVLDL